MKPARRLVLEERMEEEDVFNVLLKRLLPPLMYKCSPLYARDLTISKPLDVPITRKLPCISQLPPRSKTSSSILSPKNISGLEPEILFNHNRLGVVIDTTE